jgi:hypothetical protein
LGHSLDRVTFDHGNCHVIERMNAYLVPKEKAIFALLVATCSARLFAVDTPPGMGSGEPGLKIVYNSSNEFVIYADEPWTVGISYYISEMTQRKIRVLYDWNYGISGLISGTRTGIPQQLYPFDDGVAFTCEGGRWSSDFKTWEYWPRMTQVYSTNAEGISVSNDLYEWARKRFELTTNQLFLGKIGTNVFYWETQDPRKVFIRSSSGQGATNYFALSKGVIDIFGVTQGIEKKQNVGFMVFRKSKVFWSYAPYEQAFVEFSLKNTKRVRAIK